MLAPLVDPVADVTTAWSVAPAPPLDSGTAKELVHDRLETQVGELVGVINTATAALVATIETVLDEGIWETAAGIRSPEHWVAWQCGVSSQHAIRLVQLARRRGELPNNTELFDAGQLSEDAMAAIARRVPAEREAEVALLAPRLLHSQLARFLSSLPEYPKKAGGEEPHSTVEFGTQADRWKMRVDLPLDEGALIEKALTVARSEVFHERHPDDGEENPRTSGVTWVDGLLRAAERALTAMGHPEERRPADRFQVLLHINASDKTARLHLGPVVPDSMRRYLSCDADVRLLFETDAFLADFSPRTRTVDDRMRAFIENRDGGCRVPGCTAQRWLHIHHIRHWEDGGETRSRNLCALCPLHHRLHHLGMLGIEGDPSTIDGLTFRDQRGRIIGARPPTPGGRPPDSSVQPYVHPSGERADWHWIVWPELDSVG
ncbi:MAG: hypothetical protein QOC92_4530 [Acidimicrobiaceae bacterium]